MKNVFLGITIAFLLLCGNAFAQTQPTADEQAIFTLMTNVGKAWEARDLNKFAENLTEECTHIDPQGVVSKGREAVKKHLQWAIENVLPKDNSKMDISDVSLRFVNSEVGLLTYLAKEGGKSIRETVVLSKVKNDWKITSFQLTFVGEQSKTATK